MRTQNPSVLKTAGRNPKWYIRPWVEKVEATGIVPRQERIYLGSCDGVSKRAAIVKKNEVMTTINRRSYVVQAQMRFGDFLDHYLKEFVQRGDNLAASTRAKYEIHIETYIRPALGHLQMAAVDTRQIDAFLAGMKTKKGKPVSYATRLDARNVLSRIFSKAEDWGLWKDRNPALRATVGRARAARPQVKLTTEQTYKLLAALPEDVRLIIQTSLYCTLRVSEILGLQWKHFDPLAGVLHVRQRYYRGDVDEVKSERASRDVLVPPELLKALVARIGAPEDFIFSVRTCRGQSRDDRSIARYFLKAAARKLGIDFPGLGFHSFRREAITGLQKYLTPMEVARMAGHSHVDMVLHYTLADTDRQAEAVRLFEESMNKRPN